MNRHPLSSLFARFDLKDEDLNTLAEDIQEHGLLLPITLHDGMILDGWNRYQACIAAGVKPQFVDLGPGIDPWEFVKGSNMLRRHMTPAERVAVMLLKMKWDGEHSSMNECSDNHAVQNCTPSVSDIEKDLEVSRGTAQKARQIIEASDSAINEALSQGSVSLDRAAEIARMPKEERQAALETPKPKPAPKDQPDDRDARIAELERMVKERDEEIEDLRERLADTGELLKGALEDLASRDRILDGEDLLVSYKKEVSANVELARVTQSRNNGLMTENFDLAARLKSALRKIERMSVKVPVIKEVAS